MRTFFLSIILMSFYLLGTSQSRPNVILIYTDDLGYGDLSCYGATAIHTPHIDSLAKTGIRFTNGHSTSATCTPSRYALLTGQYPWRKKGTSILPGDAALIIPTDTTTLATLFKQSGYATGIVGKWHLGLGSTIQKNWNEAILPGPNEVGFDYSFIFPATADRVPTVFIENHNVVNTEHKDPIEVSYAKQVGNDPTVSTHPALLKMKSAFGHNGTIVNGIGRIGYMSGGINARWTDEEMPLTFLKKANNFISTNKQHPFFLYYSLTEPHVPRMPAMMFKGKSGLGYRGDVILQLDWTVGQLVAHLKNLGLDKNTIIIFSSDNGPVLNDGYVDDAVELLQDHTPWGPLRGGKYSSYEAGTRVPFILSWPGKITPAVSPALVSQIDLLASFANFFSIPLPKGHAPDSQNMWDVLLGKSISGRTYLIEQGANSFALVKDNWKYIEPNNGLSIDRGTGIELGNSPEVQLFDLKADISERNNLAKQYPSIVKELCELMQKVRASLNQ